MVEDYERVDGFQMAGIGLSGTSARSDDVLQT